MSCYDIVHEVLMQNGATATGNGTAWTSDTGGMNDLVCQVVIGDTATVTFEATNDGSNWIAVQATNLNDGNAATTATASGLYRINVSGINQVRARISAYTSGTVTVLGRGQA